MPIKQYSKGQRLSASDLNDLTGEATRQGKLSTKPPFYTTTTGAGTTLALTDFTFFVRITAITSTGSGSGSGALTYVVHDWVEVELMADGSHRDKDQGRHGSNLYSVTGDPAAVNSVVKLFAAGETYWFSSWPGDETAYLTVTGGPSSGRYPAIRRIENGVPSAWGFAENAWLYEANGRNLTAGKNYLSRRNRDQFGGLDQWATEFCCGGSGSGSGSGDSGPTVQTDCCPQPIPTTIHVTVTITSGSCPDFDGQTWTVNYLALGGDPFWRGSKSVGGHTMYCDVTCSGGFFTVSFFSSGGGACLNSNGSSITSASCDPFIYVIQFDATTGSDCCPGVTFTATITA
jgi:hypothetical protein